MNSQPRRRRDGCAR